MTTPFTLDEARRLVEMPRVLATVEALERLRGLRPELPPFRERRPGLPRYGLRWNGPTEPLSVPMADGYWTPWECADSDRERLAQSVAEAVLGEVLEHVAIRSGQSEADDVRDVTDLKRIVARVLGGGR